MRKLRALLTHLNEVYATKAHSVSNVSHTYDRYTPILNKLWGFKQIYNIHTKIMLCNAKGAKVQQLVAAKSIKRTHICLMLMTYNYMKNSRQLFLRKFLYSFFASKINFI